MLIDDRHVCTPMVRAKRLAAKRKARAEGGARKVNKPAAKKARVTIAKSRP